MIIKEHDLVNIAPNIEFVPASIESRGIELLISAQDYISFCTNHGINLIFYMYKGYNKEKLLVSEELLDRFTDNKAEYAFCKKWAESYNSAINNRDYSRPYSLTMACQLDSLCIFFKESDEWLTKEELVSGEDALIYYIESHEDELSELYENCNEGDLTLADELKLLLLSDPAFRLSTTKSSRSQYVDSFIRKKDNKKFLGLVRKTQEDWEREDLFTEIVNRIYEEYRYKCRNLKIHIGDPLPKDMPEI